MKLSDLLIENNSVIMEKAKPNDALPAFQIAETTKPDTCPCNILSIDPLLFFSS